MRAAVCRAFGEPLVIEDLRLEPTGPHEVRVEVAACAICHSDIHYAEGSWGGALPAVYGHEAAGTVAEVGESVSEVAVGDRVAMSLIRSCSDCAQCRRGYEVFCEAGLGPPAHRLRTAGGELVEASLRCGAFAEEATVHHSQAVLLPDDLDSAAAALLGCGVITGVGAVVNTSTVDETSTVVVVGAGGVGLNAVQAAALVGAPVIVGMPETGSRLEIDPLELADTGRRIVGCKMGSAQPRRDIERIVAWHRDGALKLEELVSGVYPLEEINEAIAVVKRGEAIRNVIALRDL